ncbi:hypothetical protein ONZ43_g4064 [Nemania bipapillata]|uniref:Uncharacterized protein n=1 Tax=Nemania bipapillata TaxID=110536 RepID=A0ACC2ISB7_9PEZI|nr:hypothetical protein ONZ43_g4064 [Nemania bipapillata]
MYDLAALDDTSVNGTVLVGYQYHGRENQQWKLEKLSDGPVWPTWRLLSVGTGKCADVENGDSKNGARAQIWSVGRDNNNQAWRIVSADPLGRVVMLQNVSSGTYLDISGGRAENGTRIQTWAGSLQNPNQMWRVLRMK